MPSKLCFETDMSVYKNSIPFNKHAFTIANVLNMKIQIISDNNKTYLEDKIYTLEEEYKIQFPHSKLWIHDLDKKHIKTKNLICILLFINDVYGLYYICNTNTLEDTKYHILETILNKIDKQITQIQIPQPHSLDTKTNTNKYVLLINTFNSDGKTETSKYEPILCC
jgi:hypothetical protein